MMLATLPFWGSALVIALWASITIRRRRLPHKASTIWLSAVWLLPWIGGVAWGGYWVSTLTAEHYLDRFYGDPDPPLPSIELSVGNAERRW